MRGLKLHVELKDKGDIVSHLLQMRGLKQIAKDLKRQEVYVASFTDAWIETSFQMKPVTLMESHLLQMRGLKPKDAERCSAAGGVASFTDAWIETPVTPGR